MGLLNRVRLRNAGLKREAMARRKVRSAEMDWKALLGQEEGPAGEGLCPDFC